MIDNETIQALNHETKVRKSKEGNVYATNKKGSHFIPLQEVLIVDRDKILLEVIIGLENEIFNLKKAIEVLKKNVIAQNERITNLEKVVEKYGLE